jgi:hypothetical protein
MNTRVVKAGGEDGARTSNCKCYPVPVSLIEDKRLSFAARGLLSYLISRTEDTNVEFDGYIPQLHELSNEGYITLQENSKKDVISITMNEVM